MSGGLASEPLLPAPTRACTTPLLRDILRARAAPCLPGPPAEEPVKLAPRACFLLSGLPVYRASQ